MDYASSLRGLLPGGRRTPGLKELLSSAGEYLAPEPAVPDADNQSSFRAPQFGLGD